MIARFRVATRAGGVRRQVYVHLYDDRVELARAHAKARGVPYEQHEDTAGGVAFTGGWWWPRPDPGPVTVMRLWTGQLTLRTIAHESVHAGALVHLLDALPGWDSRARTVLIGNNEVMAYAVGDITAEVTRELIRRGHVVR